jgi:SpoVK/Ycf46/Vps4 family AAA+-type ATPase
MNDIEDIKRCFRDKRRIGPLSKDVPLQSALSLLIISNEEKENLNSFLWTGNDSALKKSQSQIVPAFSIDSKKLAADVLHQLPARSRAFPVSYQQTLDSVMAISDNTFTENRTIVPQPNVIDLSSENPAVSKNFTLRNIASDSLGTIGSSTIMPSSVHAISKTTEKRNPFGTAKAQFIKEGGKLDSSISSENRAKKPMTTSSSSDSLSDDKSDLPPELQQYEKHLIEKIESDIIHTGHPVRFQDVAGLDFAKKTVQEIIVWPMTRPDLFKGLRAVPKGLLLFGPPGKLTQPME